MTLTSAYDAAKIPQSLALWGGLKHISTLFQSSSLDIPQSLALWGGLKRTPGQRVAAGEHSPEPRALGRIETALLRKHGWELVIPQSLALWGGLKHSKPNFYYRKSDSPEPRALGRIETNSISRCPAIRLFPRASRSGAD